MASPDVVLVPGGEGNRPLMRDEPVLGWLRSAHESSRFTTSVCTGALVLGAAGILDGLRATTHWAYLEYLGAFGAEPIAERVVEDGKVITAAGVVVGDRHGALPGGEARRPDVAKAIQLGIEYDPEPPYDSGSPHKAPPSLVEAIRRPGAGTRPGRARLRSDYGRSVDEVVSASSRRSKASRIEPQTASADGERAAAGALGADHGDPEADGLQHRHVVESVADRRASFGAERCA